MSSDGGPAFPFPDVKYACHYGMSVRTWLVGQALSGMTGYATMNFRGDSDEDNREMAAVYIDAAEWIADEHLRRLAEGNA